MAYGRDGYREIVERCCDLAADFGRRVKVASNFELLAPVRLNGVVFALAGAAGSAAGTAAFLARLRDDGRTFLTPTTYGGRPAVRISVTNWRTTADDVVRAWEAIEAAAA